MLNTPIPEPHGIYPLTLFDDIYTTSGIAMGWLVEGILDLNLISAALDRLLSKWPALAGRLERTSDNPKTLYQIRFPAGAYPKEYAAYTLTSTVSAAPISDFLSLPLPPVSTPPPRSLFIHSSAPRSSRTWASRQHPLTCWHVTHFPQDGQEYTCVGVSFSHGLFDGMGISYFVHALEAEMLGREPDIPTALHHEGLNVNPLQQSLDTSLEQSLSPDKPESAVALVKYDGVTPGTIWMAIGFVWGHLWQKWRHGASCSTVILPPKAYTTLVDQTRKDMEANDPDVRLSTGDVLVAWFYKTIYSDGTPLSRTVHCTSMAHVRSLFPDALRLYPHNCFLPMPYPIMTVGELQSMPLHVLARSFAKARSSQSLSPALPISMYKLCIDAQKEKHIRTLFPFNFQAQETFTVSNVSISRIVDIDWTGVGGRTTVARYQYILNEGPVFMTNVISIAGRGHDGSIFMDVVLTKKRLARIEAAVRELLLSSG